MTTLLSIRYPTMDELVKELKERQANELKMLRNAGSTYMLVAEQINKLNIQIDNKLSLHNNLILWKLNAIYDTRIVELEKTIDKLSLQLFLHSARDTSEPNNFSSNSAAERECGYSLDYNGSRCRLWISIQLPEEGTIDYWIRPEETTTTWTRQIATPRD